jgi:hypothetical protein
MTPLEIAAILALTAWAVYRQTVVAEITLSPARFRMAAVYAVVGLLVGGFDLPHGWAGWAMIATGLALSVVVGLVRGRCTRIWAADGRLWRQAEIVRGRALALVPVAERLGTVSSAD